MQIKILSFWLGKPILLYEIKAKLGPTPIDGVYISEIIFAKELKT